MNTVERKQLVNNLCNQFIFLVSYLVNHSSTTPFVSTTDKEYGSYRCGISIKDSSLSLSLRTRQAKSLVYSIYVRYGYSCRLKRNSWYIQSCPYKRGKKDCLLEVSLDVYTLDNSCFELLLRVIPKDTQLKSLDKLVDLWVEDLKKLQQG